MTHGPTLSIIIPVFCEPLEICRALSWLRRCPGIETTEIIVADGDAGSSRVPRDILPVKVINSPPGRGRQLNAAASSARADVLLFLHVDTRPPRRFVGMILRSVTTRPAGAFDLHIETRHPFVRLISLVGLARSRITRVPYGDQAQFVTRRRFDEVGGFPDEPLMEDVALMDRLKDAGAKIRILRPPAVTSGRRWESEGAVKTTLRNWRLMLAYRAGVSPRQLRRRYRPQPELDAPDILAVFHRSLLPGRVKTRLAADTSDTAALELYRAMLTDLADSAENLSRGGFQVDWFVDDHTRGSAVVDAPFPQLGADLWDRMVDTFERCFASGAARVVLCGSDIPGLRSRDFARAFRLLHEFDLVLGPSDDGGFYLLGGKEAATVVAALRYAAVDPRQGGERVSEWARANGREVGFLPRRTDVDTLADLHVVLANPAVYAPGLRSAARRMGV